MARMLWITTLSIALASTAGVVKAGYSRRDSTATLMAKSMRLK